MVVSRLGCNSWEKMGVPFPDCLQSPHHSPPLSFSVHLLPLFVSRQSERPSPLSLGRSIVLGRAARTVVMGTY